MMMRTLVLSLILTVPLAAQAVREDMLVSSEWLSGHLDAVTVLHVGDKASYEAGHIPGAALLDISAIAVTRDGIPNELPPVETLETVFGATGIGNEGRVILYANDPPLAERAWFTLDYLGHGSRAAILDGGFRKWSAEKRPVSTQPFLPKVTMFKAHPRPAVLSTLAAMRGMDALDDEQFTLKFALIDSRPPEQFEDPGHIRRAANVPLGSNYKDGVLRPPAELRAMYEAAGVSADTANVTYCRSGMQAAATYFVLKYLGYDATVYDGSYAEWSKAGEKPE